jgi:type III pantothenate kinase
MRLLIDVGNTALKAAHFDGSHITPCNVGTLVWQQVTEVVYACVGKSEQLDALLAQAATLNIPCYEAVVSAQLENLHCAYEHYQNLGIDRWLAIIATYTLWPKQDCIIVDAGTATTIDVLDADGLHRGGWIIPGLDLMTRSLTQNTQRVFDDEAIPFSRELGINTPNGLKNGALVATMGAIEQAKQHLSNKTPRLIFAGGYGKLLQTQFSGAIFAPQLVMHGLSYWRDLSEK